METPDKEEARHGDEGAPRGLKFFDQPWLVVSCVLLAASAVLLYFSLYDATFVVASLGVLAWFLNVRANLQRRHPNKEIDEEVMSDE